MTDFTKATPRPWAVETFSGYPGSLGIRKDGGKSAFAVLTRDAASSRDEQRANAALIVEAVNSYDRHLALLEKAREFASLLRASAFPSCVDEESILPLTPTSLLIFGTGLEQLHRQRQEL